MAVKPRKVKATKPAGARKAAKPAVVRKVKPAAVALPRSNKEANDALWLAVNTGDGAGVKAALDKGADPNYCAKNWRKTISVLGLAVSKSSKFGPYPVDLLLEAGALVNGPPGIGPPLHDLYIYGGHGLSHYPLGVLRKLLDAGADVTLTQEGQSILHGFFEGIGDFDSTQMLQLLIKAGADVNCRDWQGNTPLHTLMKHPEMSAEREILECLRIMIISGANIEARCLEGRTVFHACRNSCFARVLLRLKSPFQEQLRALAASRLVEFQPELAEQKPVLDLILGYTMQLTADPFTRDLTGSTALERNMRDKGWTTVPESYLSFLRELGLPPATPGNLDASP